MTIINDFIFFGFIGLAMFFDVTKKKIPNMITFPVIVWGLFSNTLLSGFGGLRFAGIGFLIGLGIFLVPFALGGMGGGDVKMLAAIGAMKGWQFILMTAIFAGLIGGLIVVVLLIKQRKLGVMIKRIVGFGLKPLLLKLMMRFENNTLKRMHNYFLISDAGGTKEYIPYGVAIGLGGILTYFLAYFDVITIG